MFSTYPYHCVNGALGHFLVVLPGLGHGPEGLVEETRRQAPAGGERVADVVPVDDPEMEQVLG